MTRWLRSVRSNVPSAVTWLRGRLPETAILALGVYLRLTMLWRFNPGWGYDAGVYWEVVEWMLNHGTLPPPGALFCGHHPPLYFAVVAALVKLGLTHSAVVAFPILCGVTRLVLVWIGLEWYLPRRRTARVAALALAAVLPVSVHIDGSLYPEPVNGMFAAGVLLLLPKAFESEGRRRWALTCGIGVLLGLEMLTKITALALFLTIGVTLACRLALPDPTGWRTRAAALAPWSAVVVLPVVIAGWYFARNIGPYHTLFLTGYETAQNALMTDELAKTPILDRRSLGFVFGWDASIYEFPYYPSGLSDHPRFFPVTLASTFVDYYNQAFSGLDPWLPGPLRSNRHILTPELVATGRWSAIGGTILLVGAVGAGAACLLRTFQARNWGRFCLALVPGVVSALALYAATKYPFDRNGVIKGAYMLFGAPPMYAFYGLAVDWARARRWRRPLAALLLLGLAFVAVYTVYCRTGILLFPPLAHC
jgi:hypothetical protein